MAIGAVTGAYGTSFGAVAVAAGLSPAQACALSVLMFTGGSQFAMVGTVAGGGHPLAGAATTVLLGARNAFWAAALAPAPGPGGAGGWPPPTWSSTRAAMGAAQDDPGALGLDVAGPAAFVALLAPRLRGREPWTVAQAGVPVLLAAAVAVAADLRRGAG
ncbi:MAG TPA: AzlC family ABC transporter permease [Acidimicrobiales bacterium]|nr:AzlC family ABC transporter permease [Acidimicrobiales bacterium]